MADFVASALLPFQSRINKKYNAAELRERQNPILGKALGYNDLIVDNVMKIKESDKRSVYTYYKKRMTASNGTARSYAPTGVQADSGQVTLSWVTFSETLGQFYQVGADNMFSDTELLDHEIMEKQRILRERIGDYIVAQLHAARTQNPYTITAGAGNTDATKIMTWDAVNFAFTNPQVSANRFFQYASNVMKQNKYYGKFDAIADANTAVNADFLSFQGGGNQQNLSFQFQDYNGGKEGIMFHSSLGVQVAEPFPSGCAIVLPEASFSVIPWIPMINRKGKGDYTTFNGGFGTIGDGSGMPLEYAVRGWAQKADGSGNGSVVQTEQLQMELSVDICFVTAPMSNAGETPIYEFGQM